MTTAIPTLLEKQDIRNTLQVSSYIFNTYYLDEFLEFTGIDKHRYKQVNRFFNLNESREIRNYLFYMIEQY